MKVLEAIERLATGGGYGYASYNLALFKFLTHQVFIQKIFENNLTKLYRLISISDVAIAPLNGSLLSLGIKRAPDEVFRVTQKHLGFQETGYTEIFYMFGVKKRT